MDTKQKVKIVFDTDIGGDCDDAGALAMLHRLCDLEEAQLVAVTASYASPFVAGCIDAVNTYFGRKVPVGVCYDRTIVFTAVSCVKNFQMSIRKVLLVKKTGHLMQ